jgi:hypothetical protein
MNKIQPEHTYWSDGACRGWLASMAFVPLEYSERDVMGFAPVAPGRLVNHGHVMGGGLIILDPATIHKHQLAVGYKALDNCSGLRRLFVPPPREECLPSSNQNHISTLILPLSLSDTPSLPIPPTLLTVPVSQPHTLSPLTHTHMRMCMHQKKHFLPGTLSGQSLLSLL